jgi:small acid-soluble spore protein (thioredoxin-like protein)
MVYARMPTIINFRLEKELFQTMAKPDNREDNVENLQQSINNTIENLEESEQYLSEHADEIDVQEKQTLQAKNERREESLDAFRNEIEDESEFQQNQP